MNTMVLEKEKKNVYEKIFNFVIYFKQYKFQVN